MVTYMSPKSSSDSPSLQKRLELQKKHGFLVFFQKPAWKSHLRYLDRPENIRNGKIVIFYIEAIPQFFSQLRQKIFFELDQNNFLVFSASLDFSKDFLINPL